MGMLSILTGAPVRRISGAVLAAVAIALAELAAVPIALVSRGIHRHGAARGLRPAAR
jgi:hypothetical protein